MWARTGNVNVTASSLSVSGGSISPMFVSNGVKPGYAFIGPDGRQYEIATVVSETSLSLVTAYLGTTLTNQAYAVMQLSAAAYSQTLEEVSDLLAALSTNIAVPTIKIGSPTETAAVAAFFGPLVSHENNADVRNYISKGATANTASLELSAAKSGRGRLALVTNNDVRLDYSADGTTWFNLINGDVTTSPSNPRVSFGFPLVPRTYTIATLPTSIAGALVYVSDLGGGGGLVVGDGTGWRRAQPGYVTDAATTGHTHTELVDANNVLLTGTLGAGATLTLSTTNARPGATRRYTRTGGGAFNWSINGLKNIATSQWCDVTFNGSTWYLGAFGSL